MWHLRLTPAAMTDPLADGRGDRRAARRAEADEFYAAIHPPKASDDEKLVQRQALAGMLWTKQIYLFDVTPVARRRQSADCRRRRRASAIRNAHWRHLNSMRILSMPDKWEYPWFAAWDLAFHCVALALVDPAFAKDNLWVLLFEQFQHPERSDPGVRVGVLRPEPAGARLGVLARVQRREGADRRRPTASSSRSAFRSC